MCRSQTSAEAPNAALAHEAILCHGRAQFMEIVGDFVQAGLERGEPTLAALTPECLGLLTEGLGRGLEQLRVEDTDEVGRNPARLLSLVAEWVDCQPGRVRFVAEPMSPGRSEAEAIEGARHDALMNHAFAGRELTVLCLYDRWCLDHEALAWAERAHPMIAQPDRSTRPSTTFESPTDLFAESRWPFGGASEPEYERSFDADLASLRRFVNGSDCVAALIPERREDFVVALNEAAQNVVKHGRGEGMLRLWREQHAVVGEVRGPGELRDPMVGYRRPEPTAVAGRGLWLINQLTDLVQVRSECSLTTVRIHMRTDPVF
jgi:anti-sigma regulatory factor (Ser/Thr protein kinase)